MLSPETDQPHFPDALGAITFTRRDFGKRLLLGASAVAVLLATDRREQVQAAPAAIPATASVALGTTFTYDGILTIGGSSANGTYDFEFRLFDAVSAGVQVGSTLIKENVVVRDGHYRVELDFGNSAFAGSARWLQVGYRIYTSTGSFSSAEARRLLAGTPYALYARRIPLAGTGKSGYAARSDHNHFGVIWTGVTTFGAAGLQVTDTSAQSGFGLVGVQHARSAWTAGASGVWGDSADRIGVSGTSDTGTGVDGTSSQGVGVSGWSSGSHAVSGSVPSYASSPSTAAGVFGSNEGTNGNGVIGEANNGTAAYAIWGRSTSGYAGVFSGKVAVTGTLSKGAGSFKIDHPLDPENKYLYHSFVESPDMKNVYDGNVTTDSNGEATVQMPDWFEALNRDFRYQLTVVGQFAQAIVADKIRNNRFTIKTDKPSVEVSWQVTGIRQDAFATANRIPVEEVKSAEERGTYLHPAAHGKPESAGVDAERVKKMHMNNPRRSPDPQGPQRTP